MSQEHIPGIPREASLQITDSLEKLMDRLSPVIFDILEERRAAEEIVRKEHPELFIETRGPRTPREKKRYAKNRSKRVRRHSKREALITAKVRELRGEPIDMSAVCMDALKTHVVVEGYASVEQEINYLEEALELPIDDVSH